VRNSGQPMHSEGEGVIDAVADKVVETDWDAGRDSDGDFDGDLDTEIVRDEDLEVDGDFDGDLDFEIDLDEDRDLDPVRLNEGDFVLEPVNRRTHTVHGHTSTLSACRHKQHKQL
jgi:hypothetical protein